MTRRRRSVPRPVAEALDGLLDDLAPDDDLARVQRAWSRVVGAAVAAAGRPVALRDGVLHLACEDATWAQELQLLEPEILGRLADTAGLAPIRAVRVRAGGGVDGSRSRPGAGGSDGH